MRNFDIGEYATGHIQKAKKILSGIAGDASLSLSKSSMVYKAILMLDDLDSCINSEWDKNRPYTKHKYAILKPRQEGYPAYIGWVADSEFDSWLLFFGKNNTVCSTVGESMKAFKAIGYKTVQFTIGKQYTILEDKNSTGE